MGRSGSDVDLGLLEAAAGALAHPLTPAQLDQFARYAAEIRRWSAAFSLTGLRRDADLLRLGFLDSLACLLAFEARPGQRAIDVGSGAGFPGIPVKIALPDLDLTLLEASRKKASFLRHAARALGLSGARVEHGRAEVLAARPEHARAYDVAFCRAVAVPDRQAALCLPFLRPGGTLVSQRGPASADPGETPGIRAWRPVPAPPGILAPGRRIFAGTAT